MSIRLINAILKLPVIAMVVVLYIHYFFPQSWGFYTIKSNLPLYNIYVVRNGIVDKTPLIRNNFSYGMGISRKGKILYSELYDIANKNLPWKHLNKDSLRFYTLYDKYTPIAAGREPPNFKGQFLITKTSRPSFLDLKNGEQFHPSVQYILANIR